MATTETIPRNSAEAARTSLEEVRDALRELTRAVTRLERTTRAAQRKPRGRPPQVEIGEIRWAWFRRKTTVKTGGWTGTRTETIDVPVGYFCLLACGPRGRYRARNSEDLPVESLVYHSGHWPKDGPDEVRKDNESQRIHNEFLALLWQDGWQPTSFDDMRHGFRLRQSYGWYNVTLRRAVVETADQPPRPADTSGSP
jgi:hypothetical protein